MPEWFDIAVNLSNKRFSRDRAEVVSRARDAGVVGMLLTGTSLRASQVVLDQARTYGVQSTAGVHPHDAKSCDDSTLDVLRELAAEPEVVAIGECGLDFDRDFSPRPVQERWFEAQLELAAELSMPVFLHERAAHARQVEILSRWIDRLPAAITHCFTGTGEELDRYLELGCHIGITGWICDERRGTGLQEIVERIPLDRLVVETDAPYLTPRDMRPKPSGGRNEPAFVAHIGAAVARFAGHPVETVASATTANARRILST